MALFFNGKSNIRVKENQVVIFSFTQYKYQFFLFIKKSSNWPSIPKRTGKVTSSHRIGRPIAEFSKSRMCQNAEKIIPKQKIPGKSKFSKFQFPERKWNYRKKVHSRNLKKRIFKFQIPKLVYCGIFKFPKIINWWIKKWKKFTPSPSINLFQNDKFFTS